MAHQLLVRHGVITRETVAAESIAGGFSAVYQVLKAMEEAGRIRRGYFVAGLGAAQFAMPAALDLLRSMRDVPDEPRTVVMAATDPANPYGASIKWPELVEATHPRSRPTRAAGAISSTAMPLHTRRGERELLLFHPKRSRRDRGSDGSCRMLLHLRRRAREDEGCSLGESTDAGHRASAARLFIGEGFAATAMGIQARTERLRPRGYGSPDLPGPTGAGLDATGIGIAATGDGGGRMAEPRHNKSEETLENTRPRTNEDSESEHDRVRSTNDQDQEMEREGVETKRNRGYDAAVRGEDLGDLDPDSAESEVDRDDTGEE
jgi:hypothetical protein